MLTRTNPYPSVQKLVHFADAVSMKQNNQQEHDEHIAIPVTKVAELLNVSERHVWAMKTSGRLPRSLKLGRRVLWSRTEIVAWFEAGAPTRDKWEAMKARNFSERKTAKAA